jgi:hypothetical protein
MNEIGLGKLVHTNTNTYRIRSFARGGRLAVTMNHFGGSEVYALEKDGRVHRFAQDSTGAWTDFAALPGASGLIALAVAANEDGRLEVFGVDGASGVWHLWQNGAPGGDWIGASRLATPENVRQFAAGTNRDGRLEVFALGASGRVFHAAQATPNGGWNSFSVLGTASALTDVAVAANQDGRLEVFACSGSNLVHAWQQGMPGGAFSDWAPIAAPEQLSAVAAASNKDGRLEAFALGVSGRCYHVPQNVINGGWGVPAQIGGIGGLVELAVAANQDGRLEVFGVDAGGTPRHAWQQGSPGGAFGDWVYFARPAKLMHPAPVLDAGGILNLFVLDDRWALDRASQQSQNGGWGPWTLAGFVDVEPGPTDSNLLWQDWMGDNPPVPLKRRYRPTSLPHLASIVRSAANDRAPVRAVGSSWSFSDAAAPPGGYLVETHGLNQILEVPFAGATNEHLVHVEAGIRLVDFNDQLDNVKLALPSLGGSAGQTLAGVVSTGTHGGDFNLPPIPDIVRAIQLVGPDGSVYWIEKQSRPITDAAGLLAKFPYLDAAHVKYDDEWFNAALVSMGSFGIIYSLVIAVVPSFNLVQQVWTGKWSEVRAKLAAAGPAGAEFDILVAPTTGPRTAIEGTRLDPEYTNRNQHPPRTTPSLTAGRRFIELLFAPNLAESDKSHPFLDGNRGERTCIVTLRGETTQTGGTDESISLLTWIESLPDFGPILAVVSEVLDAVIVIIGQPEIMGLLLAVPFFPPGGLPVYLTTLLATMSADLKGFALSHPNLTQTLDHVLTMVRNAPSFLVPGVNANWLVAEITKLTLPSGRSPGLGKSYEIMTGKTAELEYVYTKPPAIVVDSLEVFFDASTPAYLDTIDALLDLVHSQGVFSGYIAARFTQRTTAYLGMQQSALTCSIEITPVKGQPGNDQLMVAVQDFALDPSHPCRLHWGQRNDRLTADVVKRMYPDLLTWRFVRAGLTHNGAFTTFDSPFTARCGLSTPLAPAVYIVGPDPVPVPWQKASGRYANSASGSFTVQVADMGAPVSATWTTPSGTRSGVGTDVSFGVDPNNLTSQSLSVQVVDKYGVVASATVRIDFFLQDPSDTSTTHIHKILPNNNP